MNFFPSGVDEETFRSFVQLFRIGATPEILLPLSPSLVFRSLAPATMAEDIRRFVESARRQPEAQARLREACRRHVESRYAWDLAMDTLEGTLAGFAGAPARATVP